MEHNTYPTITTSGINLYELSIRIIRVCLGRGFLWHPQFLKERKKESFLLNLYVFTDESKLKRIVLLLLEKRQK
jgi:hypothetical protein